MADMILKGKIHKFGANVNTSEIISNRYANLTDHADLAAHCFESMGKNFANKKCAGDIIAAQDNFGCGSSIEQAALALKATGISAIIAVSFSRIFFRNAINIGLPALESPQAAEAVEDGDNIEIDLNSGKIKNITKNENYVFQRFPEFIKTLLNAGGLMKYIQK